MEIELRQLWTALRRLWWIPLMLGLLGASLGYGLSSMQSKTYSATTQLLVTPPFSTSAIVDDGNRAETYRALVESGPVLYRVIQELGLSLDRNELSEMIDARVVAGTQIIEITVSDTDAQRAADIANTTASQFEAQVGDLTTGQLQDNLDSLKRQSDALRGRENDINARLTEIDSPSNEDDADVQTEIANLEAERLRVQQTIADLDSAIRQIDAQLVTSVTPVTVADTAEVAEQPDSPKPLLMCILGAVLGAMLGSVLMVGLELFDGRFRNDDDIEALTGVRDLGVVELKHLSGSGLSPSVHLIRAHLLGQLKTHPDARIAIVSPRTGVNTSAIAHQLDSALGQRSSALAKVCDATVDRASVVDGGAVLENADALNTAVTSGYAVLVAQEGQSSQKDVQRTAEMLRADDVSVLGAIVLH